MSSSHFESIAKLASNSINEDDLLTVDEVKVYTDEGDAENKSPENLSEDKEGLVDQSDESTVDVLKPISTNFKLEARDYSKSNEVDTSPAISYVPALCNGVSIGMLPTLDDTKSKLSQGINFNFSNFDINSIAKGTTRLPICSNAFNTLCSDLPQWSNGSVFPMSSALHESLIQPFGISLNNFPSPFFHGAASLPFPNSGLYVPSSQSYPFSFGDQLRPWDIMADTKPKKPHIKKPLNAFMLFMKDNRGSVVSECTLKESAAINQILGRKWHELTREEQSKYYEQARDERLKHLEMYPNWSARDNYGMRKRRRKKREKVLGDSELARKCRATYGVNQVDLWCKPCRRKKKCIRFQTSDDGCSVKSELAISTADLTSHSIEDNSEEIGIVVVDDDFVQDTNQQI